MASAAASLTTVAASLSSSFSKGRADLASPPSLPKAVAAFARMHGMKARFNSYWAGGAES